ncbi:MAG: hypothetical protein PHE84_11690 [bacterium]|nr:hypothetical protein [bacterium]
MILKPQLKNLTLDIRILGSTIKFRFWLGIVGLILSLIFYHTDLYAGGYPDSATAISYPDSQTAIGSDVIKCPNINIKLEGVGRNWRFKFKPPIDIDWKSLAPKEIRTLNFKKPDSKVINKFKLDAYGHHYYFSSQLNPILEKCFYYYLATSDGIINLKPINMIGVLNVSIEELYKRPINKKRVFYNGMILVEPVGRRKTISLGVLVISTKKLIISVKELDPKINTDLINIIKAKYPDNIVYKDRLEDYDTAKILKLNIISEGEYLFIERKFLPGGSNCQFNDHLFQIDKNLKELGGFSDQCEEP